MLHEIPQISRFHAEPTKPYTVNRTEPNRNRLRHTTKEHTVGGGGGGLARGGGGGGGGGGGEERMSECPWRGRQTKWCNLPLMKYMSHGHVITPNVICRDTRW